MGSRLVGLVLLLWVGRTAEARLPIDLDLSLFLGPTLSSTPPGGATPFLVHMGGRAFLGYAFSKWSLGIALDKRAITQLSDTDSVTGFRAGSASSFWIPAVRLQIGHTLLHFGYPLMGGYTIRALQTGTEAQELKAGIGLGVMVSYPLWKHLCLGWSIEFNTYKGGSSPLLSGSTTLWQAGIVMTYSLRGIQKTRTEFTDEHSTTSGHL